MRREQIGVIETLGLPIALIIFGGARSEAEARARGSAKKKEFRRKSIGNDFFVWVPSATWNLPGDP